LRGEEDEALRSFSTIYFFPLAFGSMFSLTISVIVKVFLVAFAFDGDERKRTPPIFSFDRGQNPIQVPFFQIFLLVLIITVHLLVTEIPTNAQSRFV
jgi:hypothetical protein